MNKKIININNEDVEVIERDMAFEVYLESVHGFTYTEYVNNKNGKREMITSSYENELDEFIDYEEEW